jgi:hypothetical protein
MERRPSFLPKTVPNHTLFPHVSDAYATRQLYEACPDPAFAEYISELLDWDDIGANLDGTFLGFVEDYHDIARLYARHQTSSLFTVVDVGCYAGFQHVFFKGFAGYIGIDPSAFLPRLKAFNSVNATYVQGRFAELCEQGWRPPENSVGIANMSLLYGGGEKSADIDWFHRLFERKVMV